MEIEPIRKVFVFENGLEAEKMWVKKITDLPTFESDENGYWLNSSLVTQWYDENPGNYVEELEPEYRKEQDSNE